MMRDLFLTVLSLSVSGTGVALLLWLLRPIVARGGLSYTWQYYVWLIVLLRLVIPFDPVTGVVGQWLAQMNAGLGTAKMPWNSLLAAGAALGTEGIAGQGGAVKAAAQLAVSATGSVTAVASWLLPLGGAVWLLGFAVLFVRTCWMYIRFVKRLRRSDEPPTDQMARIWQQCRQELRIRGTVRLVRNPHVPTPLIVGLLRPTVVVPVQHGDDAALRYLFLHELTHYKRGDLWYKWLAQTVRCVHWFHPLAGRMVREIDRLCEWSCDEAVTRRMSAQDKRGYGHTLIAMAAAKPIASTAVYGAMSGTKQELKERLTAMMRKRRTTWMTILLAIVLAVGLGAAAAYAGAFSDRSVHAPLAQQPSRLYGGEGQYNLEQMAKDSTPYVGNHSQVLRLVGQLPTLSPYYMQRYIALQTTEQPYGLTVFYEQAAGTDNTARPTPVQLAAAARKHAFVLFAMIDNVGTITFALRGDASSGELEEGQYDERLYFERSQFEQWDVNSLRNDLDKLGSYL